ncbi:MAG TPA: hypothetical protein VG937_35215 [Polyangiaceae bacterium]|jgi:hypothetical protein|nr:hypothetical protein [Polyangiaceae bacterium]
MSPLDRARSTLTGILLGAFLSVSPLALGADPEKEKGASGEQPEGPPSAVDELPPLPSAPRVELEKPAAKDLSELDARLSALSASDPAERDSAARELLEVDARLVPAIAFRLDKIADSADKEALKRLFLEVRRESKEVERAESDESARPGTASPDYLGMLVQHARTNSKAFPDLIAVVAMSRMLSQIGTVEAARTLITVYVRFGEFLRIHTQRELARLGDKAVPALLEARRHQAEKIARFAARQLDALGRAVPGEAVRVTDPQVLADVLRAYGRTRDPDAARIVVSFANSERAVVREAARQAIGLFGEVSMWQLKDTYESVVGKKPPRDWSWERTARELFARFDRARSAAVMQAFEAGRAARAKGDLEAMRRAFDSVVAQNPRFERKAELAQGYLAYAKQAFDDHPRECEVALLRAERLSTDPGEIAKIQSQILTLRATESVKKGVADVVLIDRALELDRNNERARTLLAELRRGKIDRGSERARKLAAGTIGLGALIAIAALLRRRREDQVSAASPGGVPSTKSNPQAAPSSESDAPPVAKPVFEPSAEAGAPAPEVAAEPVPEAPDAPSAAPAAATISSERDPKVDG